MKLYLTHMILAASVVLLLGCTGAGNHPVAPGLDPVGHSQGMSSARQQIWGYYEITINPVTRKWQAVPLRTADITVNVNNLLEAKPGNLVIGDIDSSNYATQGRLDCTITLKHPFPGLDRFDGFDVWGVFIHNGASPVGVEGLRHIPRRKPMRSTKP